MTELAKTNTPNIKPSQRNNLLSATFGVCVAVLAGVLLGLLVVGVPNPLLVLAAGIGLFATCVIIAKIEWGLILFVFITYSYFSSVAIENFGIPSLAKLFVLLLLFAIILRWALWGERPSGWARITLLIGIYCLVGIASMPYSADIDQARRTLIYLIKDSIVAIIVVMLLKRTNALRGVVWSLLAAGILMGTMGVYQHLTGTFDNNYWGLAIAVMKDIAGGTADYRISGPIGAPNFFAQIILVLIPLAGERIWHEKSFLLKSLAAWALIVCTLSLFFTYSRGGLLALLIMLFVFMVLYPPRPKIALVLLITGIPLLYLLPPQYIDRMLTLRDIIPRSNQTAMSDDALRGRKSEMIAALHMFLDHPIRGVGLGNYEVYYQKYSRKVLLDSRLEGRQAHSRYLEILAETGLIGFGAFFLIIWMMFRGMWLARKVALERGKNELAGSITALIISMAGFLTASLFLHDDFARFFWLLIGIAFAIPNIVAYELDMQMDAATQ